MGTIELSNKVKELRELRHMAEELAAEIEAIQDTIKTEMTARDVDTLTGDDWRVTWKEVKSTRLDTTALKKALPEIAAQYTKTTADQSRCKRPNRTREGSCTV